MVIVGKCVLSFRWKYSFLGYTELKNVVLQHVYGLLT